LETDYDEIAHDYVNSKKHDWREMIEVHTLLYLLGDVHEASVLDLGCGDGFHTRYIRRHGAKSVHGIDKFDNMIQLALKEEAKLPLGGISYEVQDALVLDLGGGKFDLVTAAYLLNYAHTYDELLAMLRGVASGLKSGGRFLGVNNNPLQPKCDFARTSKYGIVKKTADELLDGAEVIFELDLGDRILPLTNYHLSDTTHRKAFEEAGFREFHWVWPRIPMHAEPAEWQDFLVSPPIIFFEAVYGG
jgi:SAM-dependent methyltransferase